MPTSRRRPGAPPYWRRGQQVVWRWGDVAEPHHAEPVTVVEDTADALVVWLAAGTPVLRRARADGLGPRDDKATMFTAPVVQATGTWTGSDVVRVVPTGSRWSTWCFFDAAGHDFQGWYVNVEDPHTRDASSTYSRDHVLDVEVEPDRTVSRKDEDELVEAVRQGRYTPDEAARISGVADEVEAVIGRWGSPFCDGWETFRPDPTWPVPPPPPVDAG